jgi:hypothetical protein
MQIKEMFVDPAQATKWLEGHVHNRELRQSKVEKYARDMKAGKWRLTAECIMFDTKGALINGQHRLWAIIEAGVPVRLMVAYGVPEDATAVIDSGIIRTALDQLKLGHNITTTKTEVAIIKRLLRGTTPSQATTDEIKDGLTRHRDALNFAMAAFPRQVRGVTVVPVYTPIVRAYYHAPDRSLLMRFCEALCEGSIDRSERREQAILMLRNWLLTDTRQGSRVGNSGGVGQSTLVYQKTERALYAYLHDEILKTLYSASAELFPLPDERLTVKVMSNRVVVVKAKGGTRTPTKGMAVEAMKRRKVTA